MRVGIDAFSFVCRRFPEVHLNKMSIAPTYKKAFSLIVCVLLATLYCAARPVLSGQYVYYQHKKADRKLPSDIIYRVHSDSRGYLWLATDAGLYVYNASTFEKFSLPGNDQEVVATWQDGDHLLCFTYSGNIINVNLTGRTAILYSVTDSSPASRIYNTPFVLGRRQQHLVHVLNMSGVSVSIPHNSIVTGKPVTLTPGAAMDVFFKDIAGCRSGTLGGIELQAEFGGALHALKMTDDHLIVRDKIFKINGDGSSSLLYDAAAWGIRGEIINSFVRKGNDLWVGFYNGQGLLAYHDYFTAKSKPAGIPVIPGIRVASIIEDLQGNTWVATVGNGLYQFSRQSARIRKIDCLDKKKFRSADIRYIGWSGDTVITGYEHAAIDIVAGAFHKRYIADSSTSDNPVLFARAGSPSWLVSKRGIYLLSADDKVADRINEVVKDAYGQDSSVYIAVKGKYRIIRGNRMQYQYLPLYSNVTIAPADPYPGTLSGTTNGLYRDNLKIPELGNERIEQVRNYDGTLFVATTRGLYILRNGLLRRHLTGKDALGGDRVIQTARKGGYYFILAGRDITLVDTASLAVAGMQQIGQWAGGADLNCFAIDESGKILVGTSTGMITLNAYDHAAPMPPPVYIRTPSGTPTGSGTIRRRYSRNNSFSFSIDVLSYEQERYTTQYTIEDAGGVVAGPISLTGRSFSIGALPPGRYQLKVYLTAANGRWKAVESCSIDICPLWWQRTWLQVLALCILLFVVAAMVRYTGKRKATRQQAQLKEENARLQLQSGFILSQLKPHFIFNALNPLQPFIIRQETVAALHYLDQFSRLLRSMLEMWRSDSVSLSQELSFLSRYIFIQQQRFGIPFEYITDIPEELQHISDRVMIPAMLLQPLFENAIEHGINKPGGSRQELRLTIRADTTAADVLLITIRNTGPALPSNFTLPEHHALQMICERLALLKRTTGYGSLSLVNTATGVQATLIIRYSNGEHKDNNIQRDHRG